GRSLTEQTMTADAIQLLLFPAIMAFAATSDLLTMTISNRISLLLAGGFFVLAIIIGMRGTEILMHISAGAVILIASFICFANGWIGGRDAKLAAATALWFGLSHPLDSLMIASLFGGALTLLLI